MEIHRGGLPLAFLGTVASAGLATGALRPRDGLIDALPVAARDYFSASELDRARRYRRPQRRLALADTVAGAAAMSVLAFRPPRRLERALGAGRGRPVAAAAATAAALSLALTAQGLPLAAIAERRARNAGLSTQEWPAWGADVAKSSALGTVFAAAGGALFAVLVRRFPRGWWVPAAAGSVAASALLTQLAPIVLDPIFNRFVALEPGELRDDVLELARAAGVEVGEVYRIDASRRTTAANAYVGGLGRTKRVVLYDTLLDRFDRAEVSSVIAHELAHVKHRDVIRSLAWLAVVAPAAAQLVERLTGAFAAAQRRRGGRAAPAEPARALPAAALALALTGSVIGPAAAALSRAFEARADADALRLTDDPAALVRVERKLCTQNVSEPEPHGRLARLLATHPPALRRIGYALAYERGARG